LEACIRSQTLNPKPQTLNPEQVDYVYLTRPPADAVALTPEELEQLIEEMDDLPRPAEKVKGLGLRV
jgi:hypothetical protein